MGTGVGVGVGNGVGLGVGLGVGTGVGDGVGDGDGVGVGVTVSASCTSIPSGDTLGRAIAKRNKPPMQATKTPTLIHMWAGLVGFLRDFAMGTS